MGKILHHSILKRLKCNKQYSNKRQLQLYRPPKYRQIWDLKICPKNQETSKVLIKQAKQPTLQKMAKKSK
jgi:hypothetical protein